MRLHTILLTLPLFAPLPAKEQAKFHELIGHWQGSGKVKATPDAEAGDWTGVSVAKSVLGGHFVREDTVSSESFRGFRQHQTHPESIV